MPPKAGSGVTFSTCLVILMFAPAVAVVGPTAATLFRSQNRCDVEISLGGLEIRVA
jgi:hypothetical protein